MFAAVKLVVVTLGDISIINGVLYLSIVAVLLVAVPTPINKLLPVCIVILDILALTTTFPTVRFCVKPGPVVNDITPVVSVVEYKSVKLF